MAASTHVTIAILDGAAGIASLAGEWQALYDRTGRELSLSQEWSYAIASVHAAPGDRIRTVTVRRGGELIALLPLIARATRRTFSHLTPLAEDYNTHSDWLFADASSEVADALVEGLTVAGVRWDRFRMSRVLADNPLLPHVVAALRRRGLRSVLRTEPPSYMLTLPGSYAAYLAARSAKFRNHLKRVQKKIDARRPEVLVLAGAQDDAGFAAAFSRILAIEQGSWKHAHGWAMSSGSAATEFWRQVCLKAWRAGRIHAQFLAIDGVPAAYNLGYVVGDDYAYLKTTFASAFRDVGAATYLRARLIEDLIAGGLRRIDFPGEPYEWEGQWTREQRGHVMLTAYSGSVRSRLLELLERLRHSGHLYHQPPPGEAPGASPKGGVAPQDVPASAEQQVPVRPSTPPV